MAYKATEPILGYKKGEVVPDDIARDLINRFAIPNVELVSDDPTPEVSVEEKPPIKTKRVVKRRGRPRKKK